LRRGRYHVLEAASGPEALALWDDHDGPVHLLLTDVVMPTMNGVDLAAAAGSIRAEMPVLFMSGHPERAGVGIDRFGSQGANLIMKPFTPDAVVARINDVLAQKPG